MIYKVHMLANERLYRTREVYVAEVPADSTTLQVLDLIFRNGQNDFLESLPLEHRPFQCCSVSVGDVAELDGVYWLCGMSGWATMTPAEFEEYKGVDLYERYKYTYFKTSFKGQQSE